MIFDKAYTSENRRDFLDFLRVKLFSDNLIENEIPKPLGIERETIFFDKQNCFELGKVNLDKDITIFEIKQKSKNDPRITLTRDAFKVMEDKGVNIALIVFYSDDNPSWRLSLLTLKKSWGEKEISDPKRYSFLLGEGEKTRTPKERLNEQIKTFDDLLECFNVEVVRKEFFNHYLNLFVRLYISIKNDEDFYNLLSNNNTNIVSFTKNLLGKIVFLYFIQKKGWFINKKTLKGDNSFFSNIWDDFKNKGEQNSIEKEKYFYNDYLEYIFYEGLNIKDRNNEFSKNFSWEIPYLNGGLFKGDYSNWKKNVAKISNDIFSNSNNEGILDIFNIYNFTIDEDDLYDKEVAIDPEMLGKIFEKMISVDNNNIDKIIEIYNAKSIKKGGKFINMDIENWNVGNNNKKLGAFYTPREIVHYMTRESLISYLINNLQGKKEEKEEKIRNLFEYKDNFLTEIDLSKPEIKDDFENIKNIILDVDKHLKKIKILDPAIGSGAFPMGILHEISTLKYYIYNVLIKHVIGEASNVSMYKIKKDIIENNIYGVDIEPGAIDIAKLRFWLSLIVEEDKPEPLPNFEFKFVCADTLISLEEEEKQIDIEGNIKDEAKFETLKKYFSEFFNVSDKDKKINLKNRIKNYTKINTQQEMGYMPSKRALQFQEFGNNFDNTKYSNSFFSPSLMMGNGGKFDIVIGNPPYIGEKGNSLIFKKYKNNEKWTEYVKKRANLYYLFLIYGLKILKNDGIVTYIIPNDLLTSDYSSHIRNYLNEKSYFKYIFDFDNNEVFEGVGTKAMIITYGKKNFNTGKILFRKYENFKGFRKNILLEKYNSKSIPYSSLDSKYWNFFSEVTKFNSVNIDYYGLTTQVGIQTGCNDASGKLYNKIIKHYPKFEKSKGLGIYVLKYGIDILVKGKKFYINNSIDKLNEKWELLNETELNFIKPIYTGNIIEKWNVSNNEKYVIWLNKENFNNIIIKNIPNIIKHLENYKIFLINRNAKNFINLNIFEKTIDKSKLYNGDGDTQGTLGKGNFYLLQKYAYGLDFENAKIAWQSRGNTKFYFSSNIFYGLSSINFIFMKSIPEYLNKFKKEEILLFICGILNSSSLQKHYIGNNNTGTKIKNIPIIKINQNKSIQVKIFFEIINNVKKLLELGKNDNILEERIDKLVYELYGLSEE